MRFSEQRSAPSLSFIVRQMKVAYYLTAFVVVAFIIGFPLVVWRIIRSTRGAPTGHRVRRLVIAFLVFWLAGVACGAGLYSFLSFMSDSGPSSFRAMAASRDYVAKKYGLSLD